LSSKVDLYLDSIGGNRSPEWQIFIKEPPYLSWIILLVDTFLLICLLFLPLSNILKNGKSFFFEFIDISDLIDPEDSFELALSPGVGLNIVPEGTAS
jgi:hypothetical protein